MVKITSVDRLEICILVDNITDGLSSNSPGIESEFASVTRRGLRAASSRCLCCAVHGFSCLLTVHVQGQRHTILFDSGPEDYAFERNTVRLGVNLGDVESIVLSHGHWDHSGAMLLALHAIRRSNGGRAVPYYAHPDMFHTRGMRMADGRVRQFDDVPSIDDLTSCGASVIATREPQVLLGDTFFVSGEIPRVTRFERGMPGQVRRTIDRKDWESDELVVDERWLAVHVASKGLFVLSACSHAGIINILNHVRLTFPDIPVHTVMGGLHLSGANEEIIPQTVEALREFDLSSIAAGHCTGWRAMAALTSTFGDKVVRPTAVGKRFMI